MRYLSAAKSHRREHFQQSNLMYNQSFAPWTSTDFLKSLFRSSSDVGPVVKLSTSIRLAMSSSNSNPTSGQLIRFPSALEDGLLAHGVVHTTA
jgi:hypothetical protein